MKLFGTIAQILAGLSANKDRQAVQNALGPLADRASSCSIKPAGLAIKAGGSTLAKIGSADYYAVVNGSIVKIAASTDMPALTGIVITANYFNVVCFYVDVAGTVTAVPGTEGATLGAVRFPSSPSKKALIGHLLITHSSTFTGGTTPLDTATTVYFDGSTAGAYEPAAVLGF